jgi:hypothetical protein
MVSRKFQSATGLPSFTIVLLGVYVAGRRPPEAKALSSLPCLSKQLPLRFLLLLEKWFRVVLR